MAELIEQVQRGNEGAAKLGATSEVLAQRLQHGTETSGATAERLRAAGQAIDAGVEGLLDAVEAGRHAVVGAVDALTGKLDTLGARLDELQEKVDGVDEGFTTSGAQLTEGVDGWQTSVDELGGDQVAAFDGFTDATTRVQEALAHQGETLLQEFATSHGSITDARTALEDEHGVLDGVSTAFEGDLQAQLETLIQRFADAMTHADGALGEFEAHLDQRSGDTLSQSEQAFLHDAVGKLGGGAQSLLGAFGGLDALAGDGKGGVNSQSAGLIDTMQGVVQVIETIKPILDTIEGILA